MPPRAVPLTTTTPITLAARPRGIAATALLACSAAFAQAPAARTPVAPPVEPVPEALTRAAAEPGAVVTESGLVFRTLKAGNGPAPAATDTVRVHYRGSFTDGREFDSSYSRGQPASFPLNRVIRCWTEGLQRMQVGSRAKLTCPSAIAYGERGARDVIPPNAVLQFEVELLGIETPR
ncbi:MAG: FKBP-type peptidyl-prolyl cis-trans isomerase [Rubrivivax sp.]|nr:FKBP-type peptidyl-prolyl cis-trans isomerase [Rubrivivax sp.]